MHVSNLGGEAGAGRALHIGNSLSEGMATGAVWLCVRDGKAVQGLWEK